MRLCRLAGLLIPAIIMLAASGCYDRWTVNYDNVPDLSSEADNLAILEESTMSEEDEKKNLAVLEKIAREKEPVYTINGGDKIEIIVYNHPDLSVKTVVTPDGHIGMVLLGQVKVSGLTLAQASEKLEKALAKYIRNPKVGLAPFEIVSENATISGAVKEPGIYPIYNGMRLADLFAKAGGALSRYIDGQTIDAADFSNSIFIRDNKIIPVDFNQAIEHCDPLHNIILRRGDYIFVATRENNMVYMIGEVKKPGRHIWNPQLGILELLADGTWLNETYWHHAIIIRGGLTHPKMYKVDLDGILRGDLPNVPLKSGDIVYVPRDNISEYNVFVRKLLPTAQLINMLITPATWMSSHF